jgi:hypothetical protein
MKIMLAAHPINLQAIQRPPHRWSRCENSGRMSRYSFIGNRLIRQVLLIVNGLELLNLAKERD